MTPRSDASRAKPASGALRGCFLDRPSSRHDHFDALDGLRGLAVLLVLASHLSNGGLDLLPGLSLSGMGKSGVYLFFVLSAFLLTRLLVARGLAGLRAPRVWADYALRRVLRIWPLYLVVLVLSWALVRAGVTGWHYAIDDAGLWRHLTLREGVSVLWSIPVEFTFYAWLPLLALALAFLRERFPGPGPAWLVIPLALLVVRWAWPPSDYVPNDVRLGPYLLLFLCGGVAAWADLQIAARTRPVRPWLAGAVGLSLLLAVSVTIPQVWAWLGGTAFDSRLNHAWFLFFGLAWSGLVLAVLHGPAWLRFPFASAPLRLVGIVSFSLYLWHMPVLAGLRALGYQDWPLAPWWGLAASVLVAMASYLVFERPWRDVRWPRRPAAAPADVR